MCIDISAPETRAASRDGASRLERFFADELGCEVSLLSAPGVHLLSGPKRDEPVWGEYKLPLLLLSRNGSAVVSVAAELLPGVLDILNTRASRVTEDVVFRVQRLVLSAHPTAKALWGRALYCEPDRFRPFTRYPVEKLGPDDPRWETLRKYFDGPVFVARARNGEVASWSAVKLKSDDVWEIAVTTEEPYRGHGLAKVVVSAATRFVLERGRLPLYVHDEPNLPSGKVARALGYQEFGREAFCSLSDTSHTGMW